MRMEKNRKLNIIQTESEIRRPDNFSAENFILYVTYNANIEEYEFKIYKS